MKNKIILIPYIIFSGVFLLLVRYKPDCFWEQLVSKAIWMPLLISFYYKQIDKPISKASKLLIIALIFSWLGDVFLQINELSKSFFIPGLLAFMSTHIIYGVLFLKPKGATSILKKKPYLLLPFFFFLALLLFYLNNNLGKLKIPVYFYSCIIFLMAILALNRYEKVGKNSFKFVLIGALIFILSDATLAVALFKQKFLFSREITIFTYVLAQFLIVRGHIFEIKKPST